MKRLDAFNQNGYHRAMTDHLHDIFISTVPGLEPFLLDEIKEAGFTKAQVTHGGVTLKGQVQDVWRANLVLRGASQVLLRLADFRVVHLAKLDKLARRLPWGEYITEGQKISVETTCKKSRIYHHKAASERIARAVVETTGAELSETAGLIIKARIIDDLCTISIDTSGDPLHKRGYKAAVNKAPLRENLAALLLRACGYSGQTSVVDPMCGSGTFVLEAAEIAAGMVAGRARSFAFEQFPYFDDKAFSQLKHSLITAPKATAPHFYGFDRDTGAARISKSNAERAGVAARTSFTTATISALKAPDCQPGLVMINPPYGKRIGDIKKLYRLYATLGSVLQASFQGWTVGLVTNSDKLARATGLKDMKKALSFSHGGLPVSLYTVTIK